MKEAGFNAVRTSHNLPSEAFLNACDSIGLLVIDEAFDGWRDGKNPYDYSTLIDTCWQDDIAAMVLRDRNHPSIFCWSIGNEILEQWDDLSEEFGDLPIEQQNMLLNVSGSRLLVGRAPKSTRTCL